MSSAPCWFGSQQRGAGRAPHHWSTHTSHLCLSSQEQDEGDEDDEDEGDFDTNVSIGCVLFILISAFVYFSTL